MLRSPFSRALVIRAACALLIPTARVGAQEPVDARSFCLPGATGQCFAFAINDVATGFDVWLRNLSPAADDVARPFAITQFALRRVNTRDAEGRRTDVASGFTNANVVTTGRAARGSFGIGEDTGYSDWPAARTFDYRMSGTYGVLGCALPAASALAGFGYVAITCPERGLDGWLRVGFRPRVLAELPDFGGLVWRPGTAADVAVQVAGCVTHLGAASGVAGPFGGAVACASAPFAGSVVPEPAVAWLTGAGLAGAWAAGRGRRRRAAA